MLTALRIYKIEEGRLRRVRRYFRKFFYILFFSFSEKVPQDMPQTPETPKHKKTCNWKTQVLPDMLS